MPPMPPKRKANDKSDAAASAAAADSPPIIVKIKIEGGKTETTADTAIPIVESSPVIQQSSSSSSSSSSADEQVKKARVEGAVEARAEMTKNISKNLTCSITHELMAYPVVAEDGRTYEKSAILSWLSNHTTSPLDPSTTISAQALFQNRSVADMIEELVATNDMIDVATKAAWQARRDEPQRLFDQGRTLEAASLGHPAAMGKMAHDYYFGKGGFEKDDAKAFDFATRAAKEGDGDGMYILGGCYSNGQGVAVDKVAALKWYEEAAKKGKGHGMYFSGLFYSVGLGCVKDDKKAAAYFKSATDLGQSVSTNELANCYYEGAGVAKNLFGGIGGEWAPLAARN